MMTSQNSWSTVCLLCLLILTGVARSSMKEEDNLDIWPVRTEGNVQEGTGADTNTERAADHWKYVDDVTDKRSEMSAWGAYAVLKRLIRSYYKKPQATKFSRFVRSRLGRMPIAFGKRVGRFAFASYLTPGHVQELQRILDTFYVNSEGNHEDNNDVDSDDNPDDGKQHDKKQEDAIGNSSGFKDELHRREHRARLSRMPLNFGKRVVKSGFIERKANSQSRSGYMRTRDIRGTLRRMPLTYGKRRAGHETENTRRLPVIASTSRLLLVPNAFGKRNWADQELPVILQQRSRLGRMPLTYGKRHDWVSRVEMSEEDIGRGVRNDIETEQGPVNVEQRSRVNRMPLTYGKRDRLGRMPFAFGKRDTTIESEENSLPWFPIGAYSTADVLNSGD